MVFRVRKHGETYYRLRAEEEEDVQPVDGTPAESSGTPAHLTRLRKIDLLAPVEIHSTLRDLAGRVRRGQSLADALFDLSYERSVAERLQTGPAGRDDEGHPTPGQRAAGFSAASRQGRSARSQALWHRLFVRTLVARAVR